jgi:hypothetical protein
VTNAIATEAAQPRWRSLLLHPISLAALTLLLLNDHWLKTAGFLPGWLTGKLSDFAGLIIAPVVVIELCALLKLRGAPPSHAAAATGLIGVLFALIKTVPVVNAVYVSVSTTLLSPFGVRATSLVDPTDLIALAALSVPLWLARGQMPPGPKRT